MSVETLRQAATLMRKRAEAATEDPWTFEDAPNGFSPMVISDAGIVANTWDKPDLSDAEYIASWHPAVALAVADWLDACVAFLEERPEYTHDGQDYAFTVARAYLGETP